MSESSGSSNQMTLATKTKLGLASYLAPSSFGPIKNFVERASHVTSVEETVEKSRSHWSQLKNNEVAKVSNMEIFKTLQAHPKWGSFFKTFGKCEGSSGDLVLGEKFAEGGQAEIYNVQLKWNDAVLHKRDRKESHEYVLKVFKKETSLWHLRLQWPRGMLQSHARKMKHLKLGLPRVMIARRYSHVECGTLLEDGRFAFLMTKEKEDLRNVINRRMLTRSDNESPFSIRKALIAMYEVAYGMNQLHNRGIIHRDIKASNVLLDKYKICYVADFECSIGVVGTGFWRAPEILEACKHGCVNTKDKLFTKAVDIYSYGMTCYEILTGKLPFEGHPCSDYDLVLQGQRPEVPNCVPSWIRQLLDRCWQSNPVARPTFEEILKILRANSITCRYANFQIQNFNRKERIVTALDERSSKFVEMWRLLQLKLKLSKLKRFSSYTKCHECRNIP